MTTPISYADPSVAPVRPRTSWAAIVSLICGVLLCIPLLTNLGAIVFGIVGLRQTRQPGVGGRGLAIAGLILGVLGLLGWLGFGGAMWGIWASSAAPRQAGEQFIADLAAGNLDAATAAADPAIATEDLQEAADYLANRGAFNGASFSSVHVSSSNGVTLWTLGGSADFANGPVSVSLELRKTGESTYRVVAFNLR